MFLFLFTCLDIFPCELIKIILYKIKILLILVSGNQKALGKFVYIDFFRSQPSYEQRYLVKTVMSVVL